MTHWWMIDRRRGTKQTKSRRVLLQVEHLEARNLLTKSLVFVPSPQISGLDLTATAAITSDDIWATGNVVTGPGMVQPVAEHFDGKSRSVVSTPSFTSDSFSG